MDREKSRRASVTTNVVVAEVLQEKQGLALENEYGISSPNEIP